MLSVLTLCCYNNDEEKKVCVELFFLFFFNVFRFGVVPHPHPHPHPRILWVCVIGFARTELMATERELTL